MELVYNSDLKDILSESNLIVDTCVLIDASNYTDLYDFLSELEMNCCTFVTIPSVLNEFTCSASNLEEYQKMLKLFESLNIIQLPKCEEKLLTQEGIKFNIAVRRSRVSNPSYVDRTLLFIPYLYHNSSEKMYLITSNHKDVPHEFFDLSSLITYADKGVFHNIGIYNFNFDKYQRIIKRI